jgi:hypothetical protein
MFSPRHASVSPACLCSPRSRAPLRAQLLLRRPDGLLPVAGIISMLVCVYVSRAAAGETQRGVEDGEGLSGPRQELLDGRIEQGGEVPPTRVRRPEAEEERFPDAVDSTGVTWRPRHQAAVGVTLTITSHF